MYDKLLHYGSIVFFFILKLPAKFGTDSGSKEKRFGAGSSKIIRIPNPDLPNCLNDIYKKCIGELNNNFIFIYNFFSKVNKEDDQTLAYIPVTKFENNNF